MNTISLKRTGNNTTFLKAVRLFYFIFNIPFLFFELIFICKYLQSSVNFITRHTFNRHHIIIILDDEFRYALSKNIILTGDLIWSLVAKWKI
jgi:hypothetical protein